VKQYDQDAIARTKALAVQGTKLLRAGKCRADKPRKEYHQWVEGHLGRYQTTRTADDYAATGRQPYKQ
jgi:hypothetical protein